MGQKFSIKLYHMRKDQSTFCTVHLTFIRCTLRYHKFCVFLSSSSAIEPILSALSLSAILDRKLPDKFSLVPIFKHSKHETADTLKTSYKKFLMFAHAHNYICSISVVIHQGDVTLQCLHEHRGS